MSRNKRSGFGNLLTAFHRIADIDERFGGSADMHRQGKNQFVGNGSVDNRSVSRLSFRFLQPDATSIRHQGKIRGHRLQSFHRS